VKKALIVIFLILIIDQIFKFWVKTHMYLGEEYHVFGNWFLIHYTENEGMAFGMKLGGHSGKLVLSIFRIIAVILIGIYLYLLTRKETKTGLIICISMIFAGALGNIIDSSLYGLLFSESSYHNHQVAVFLPEGGGYSTFLHGRVVDMLYFPLVEGRLPDWLPIWGGNDFIFFRPVFNIADSSITIGVFILIIFQRRFFRKLV
jgi:signal peptidase II